MLDVHPRSPCEFRLGMTHHCTSPPQPPSPTPHHDVMLRGEGGAGKRGSFPPLHAALRSNAELERGLGGEARFTRGVGMNSHELLG
jgi:hypothetical protein